LAHCGTEIEVVDAVAGQNSLAGSEMPLHLGNTRF
jgi:hypothetical protein